MGQSESGFSIQDLLWDLYQDLLSHSLSASLLVNGNRAIDETALGYLSRIVLNNHRLICRREIHLSSILLHLFSRDLI